MPPSLIVRGLHYSYPPLAQGGPAPEILRGLDFEVQPGEFVALLGRVGAGKTTLCMALSGLVPHATGGVFRGAVIAGGRDTRHGSVADLAATVGLVYQDPEMQLTQMRVDDEVAFGPENLGIPPAEIEARIGWALSAVGLAAERDRSPLQLSGGEQQRLAIAAVLAMHPEVLVLDEPTANLDPAGKAGVLGVLSGLARQRRTAIVVATQELDWVARYADRVLVLEDGRLVLNGPAGRVFACVEQLQALGIGAPDLAELAHELHRRTGAAYRFSGFRQAVLQLRRGAGVRSRPGPAQPEPASPPAAPEPQVSAEHISFHYARDPAVLHDINLDLHAGELVALIGPNGSGKSTLARHLTGLLKPQSGRVLLAGRDTASLRPRELARLAGYVFQNPDHQIFSATVEDEVAFGLRLQGLPPDVVAGRTAAMLEARGLVGRRATPPALLGLGQRRQVALASVMVLEPPVLVLDEPTGGLDARSRADLMAALAAYRALGRTVVLITHDMRLVAEHASRAIVLLAGQVIFDGAPRTLFTGTRIPARANLAAPTAARLARRLGLRCAGAPVLTASEFLAAWLERTGARPAQAAACGAGEQSDAG